MNAAIEQAYKKLQEHSKLEIDKLHKKDHIQIYVGSATCEDAAGAKSVLAEFQKHLETTKRNDIHINQVGCTGRCSLEPIVSISIPKQGFFVYVQVTPEAVHEIFLSHILEGKVVEKYLLAPCEVKSASNAQKTLKEHKITSEFYENYAHLPFYCSQTRLALRNTGIVGPTNIYDYVENGGFSALSKILSENDPEKVVSEVLLSKLRGRGGAGFPTGVKWGFARKNSEKERYMICNADEGDPGAFMDRSMLESDPYSIIEGMLIAGFAIGAQKGFFYIRAEYPLAVERVEQAIEIARKHGLIGKNILNSGWDFDMEIRLGAGAFVCGEETALIHSIEGERGQPRMRPPFPAVSGLWGKPTIINNVETLANLPVVINFGGKAFSQIGTEKSGGTKVFAVSGKVNRTGLVEVPMGTTLREIVFDICGGVPNGKKIKAIQTGGPAGGCIPASLLDTPVDYENLVAMGSMMGSGGLIVLDEDDCMVSMAKFFMEFSQDESCGKCVPCREGTLRMLEILDKIIEGKADVEDVVKLERLAKLVQKASLCGLGRASPNPILSTLRYFKEEFMDHVTKKTCPSKKCSGLIHYEIDPKKCVGCTACARNCPVKCISGVRREAHVIDQSLCIKCGKCLEVCRFGAVQKL